MTGLYQLCFLIFHNSHYLGSQMQIKLIWPNNQMPVKTQLSILYLGGGAF